MDLKGWTLLPVATAVFLALLIQSVGGDNFDVETAVSPREFAALEKFIDRVLPKIPKNSLVNKYAKDDLYMLRWLRAKNLDVNAAETMFLNHLKYREQENIDTIDEENFSEFEKEFPLYTDAVGKNGEPIMEMWFAEWPVRPAIIAGKGKRLSRWINRAFEMNSRRLYNARLEGKNVSQGYAMVELENFSIIQQGCPSCLPIYLNLMTHFENDYPGMYDRLYLINMPASFNIILTVLRPVMSRNTRKAIRSYVNKAEWLKELEGRIDAEERSVRFGGTKAREGY